MKNCVYRKYTGQETEVFLPEYMEEEKLTVIGSKAFLSCKTVERLILPSSVEYVEDWAFAHMKNLREIVLPARNIGFGKQVFLGCDNLQKVSLYTVKKYAESAEIDILGEIAGLDELRASLFRFFPQGCAAWLADAETEDVQRRWLDMYDKALISYLEKSDEEGFVPAFIGWFDVEDVDDQKQGYLVKVRRDKITLAFQRLLCERQPGESDRKFLYNIIAEYPCRVKEILWENPVCGRDIRYYKIWQQSGALKGDMLELLLQQLPWEEPEIKACLIDMIRTDSCEDFFAELEL